MYAFIDEDSSHKAATILSQADNSAQVELLTGKRIKIKNNQILFTFTSPSPQALMDAATAEAAQIDTDFLWELLPQNEFLAVDFAPDYFGGTASSVSAVQKAALLIALHAQPAIFNRKGKGLYKPATPEMLAVVKESLAKKAREQARCDAMVAELVAGALPPEVQAACPNIAFKPDKNGWAWKALVLAAKQVGTHPTRLLMQRGAFKSHYDLHMARFMGEQFPESAGGAAHRAIELPPFVAEELPLAKVQAFSIDDSQTTEIDDALSVTHLPDGTTEVGIHIAAPSLVMPRGSALDKLAKSRMSTVYMPGNKITMLPDAAVTAFSLDEGRPCPAVSLYCTYSAAFDCIATRTVTERVPLAANLRHDKLEDEISTEAVIAGTLPAHIPFGKELSYLYALRGVLSAQRDAVRGKPENNNRTDFNFAVAWPDAARSDAEHAQVTITTRKRGSPLDAIVSEMMILANSTWAGLLGKLGVPGVFRGQRFGKVKMSTTPMAHESIGVAHYGWFTSPLRRYSDMVNQAQLLACVQYGATAALTSPYKPKDVDLYGIVGAFDDKYNAYNAHQSSMERYWCLRWLKQQHTTHQLDAVVVRPDTVRLKHIPLYIELTNIPDGARGRPVVVDVLSWDELDLSVQARFVGEGLAGSAANQAGSTAAFEPVSEEDTDMPMTSAVTLPDMEDPNA
jgi:exoribonuclease II